MKLKTILLLFLVFLVVNTAVYYATEVNAKYKINIVLKDNLKTLQTHYKILLETQKSTAIAIYEFTLKMPRVSNILTQAKNASKEKKAELREEFSHIIEPMYKIIKKRGVLQYHFVLPNNESFYRAQKPKKFGDDLTDVRADFKYTNETHKAIRGFTQGRTAHGFRNTFPLFNKNGIYIGAMEVSFSSDSFQWYLNNISGIHSHFIVDKNIFDANTWQRNDMIIKYEKSAEAANYMIALNSIHTKEHCIDENRRKLAPIRKEIDLNMAKAEPFSSYVQHHGHIDVISFLPIENLEHRCVAWMVSYVQSPIINMAFYNTLRIRIITFFFSLLIIYFLVKQILAKQKIERQHRLLDDILNTTDDIMIITDFKDIKFSNDKFKNILSVENSKSFNQKSNHDMLSIFVKTEFSLHRDLIEKGESFSELIARTTLKDRVVSIFNQSSEMVLFKISISRSKNSEDYLVTLSDITKLKEYQIQTEKKVYLDSLTQVYNRNKFDEIFEEELARVKRYHSSFSMAILDIDKFKDFNDTYGHMIGDEVLVKLAQTVKQSLRETDTFARWGGEEFIILFRNTSMPRASVVSQKLKEQIEFNEHSVAGKITASFGLSEYVDGDTMESLFNRCDEALYRAKANGRNRIEVM